MRGLVLVVLILLPFISFSQRKIEFLQLPKAFDKEVEISGLTGDENYLYLPAERCATIYRVAKNNLGQVEPILLDPDDLTRTKPIELEGITLYKQYFLLTEEGSGRILAYNRNTKKLSDVTPSEYDFSGFVGSKGMEGIAVDSVTQTLYILRERNANFQSEVHSLTLLEMDGNISLTYKNKTTVQHPDASWRYTGLAVDVKKQQLLCLKSYYVGKPSKKNKREIDVIALKSLQNETATAKRLMSLSGPVYEQRSRFGSNVEGIFLDADYIYLTSDNGGGRTRGCEEEEISTAFIRISRR